MAQRYGRFTRNRRNNPVIKDLKDDRDPPEARTLDDEFSGLGIQHHPIEVEEQAVLGHKTDVAQPIPVTASDEAHHHCQLQQGCGRHQATYRGVYKQIEFVDNAIWHETGASRDEGIKNHLYKLRIILDNIQRQPWPTTLPASTTTAEWLGAAARSGHHSQILSMARDPLLTSWTGLRMPSISLTTTGTARRVQSHQNWGQGGHLGAQDQRWDSQRAKEEVWQQEYPRYRVRSWNQHHPGPQPAATRGTQGLVVKRLVLSQTVCQ